jgi:hypothetical protein
MMFWASMRALLLWLLGAVLTGCFAERTDYRSGEVACSRIGAECPPGLLCARDNRCYRPGELPPDAPIVDARIVDGPAADAGCTPVGDACAGRACGFASDSCGHTVPCGTMAGLCPSGEQCDGTGKCTTGPCTPRTSCPTGADCGTIDKGCGLGSLSCGGPCPATKPTCVANVCTCTLFSCPTDACGSYANGCGGFMFCGDCTNGRKCDSGTCRNLTQDEACAGLSCGQVSSGDATYTCPPGCTPPESCQGAGVANVCGCTPTRTACPAGSNCGTVDDGCGHPIVCGPATCAGTGASCGGGGTPNVCGCTDNGAACTRPCDSAINNCGVRVTCGPTCSACEQCTATGCADPQGCCCSGRYCECGICVGTGQSCP